MVKHVNGKLSAQGLKVAIVASRFNSLIVDRLVEGAIDALTRAGAAESDITVYHVPGAYELPQIARRVIDAGKHDALVCLGCVIKGATPHFDYVAGEAASGLGALARTSKMPLTFGVLTTDTIEQAIERAGTKAGNKGADAALAAVELASLCAQIGSQA